MSLPLTGTDALTVAQYSARITRALVSVGGGVVEGEVHGAPSRSRGGMLFFDLTDGAATLKCKVFSRQVVGLERHPRDGDLVQVRIDRPDFFLRYGTLTAIVSEVRLAGDGELLRRREELLRQLTAEGLCDPARRKPLPVFPRAVGVIAGAESKAMRDVIQALQDRFPPVDIVRCPALVQGVRAPRDIVDALVRLDEHPLVDVIVIARGGGSVQELAAFDDEGLCRAVFACGTPVIAAIGHTDNIPVCNHVGWAKETPSRSPELAVASAPELRQALELASARLAPLPERLNALIEGVGGVVLDASGALRGRHAEVSTAAVQLRDAEAALFAARAAGLATAREALAGVPGCIPDIADIDALAGRLDTRAATFFAARTDGVRATADTLRDAGAALEHHAHAVSAVTPTADAVAAALDTRREQTAQQGDLVAAGICKELADHLRDYGHALSRHGDDINARAGARLAAEDVRVSDTTAVLDADARRRLTDARRDLDHVTALLAASDPRHRGWVLATDDVGSVVRSASALAVGDHLTLSFHDGAAGAVVNSITNPEAA